MAPPPITPSPHRFISSKPANATPKRSSSLRFQQGASQSISSDQFTPAPRFTFSSTQKPKIGNAAAATQHVSPLSRPPHSASATQIRAQENIEDTGSDSAETEDLEIVGSTPKRRRINPPVAVTISSGSSSPSPPPTTPPYPTIEEDDEEEPIPYNDVNQTTRPRFVLPTSKPAGTPSIPSRPPSFVPPTPKAPVTPSIPSRPPHFIPPPPKPTNTPTIPSRPPLILPPRSPSPTPAPPAFFSPHRRGQKYVPGGLASSVREWIFEVSQQAHYRAHAKGGEEEGWDRRFRVGDYRGEEGNEGMVLVEERGEGKRWMLVGKGGGEMRVEVGCVVDVRGPMWEVRVGDRVYMVAVEWKVLSG